MKLIALTQGKFAQVDDSDYEWISQWKWTCATYRGLSYVVRWDNTVRPRKQLKLHRVIAGITDSKLFVDHKDGDGLNNQRENLRIATPSQNRANTRAIGKVPYIGVTISLERKYRATIRVDGIIQKLGLYKTAEEAARKRDEAAIRIYGEFAKLNFPQQ